MTREELIKVISIADISTCLTYNCHEFTGEDSCLKCAEKQLAEYEKHIREKAFDDFIKKAEAEKDECYEWGDFEIGVRTGYKYSIEIAKELKGEWI